MDGVLLVVFDSASWSLPAALSVVHNSWMSAPALCHSPCGCLRPESLLRLSSRLPSCTRWLPAVGLCGQKHCWSRPGEPVSSTKVIYFSFLHVNSKITAYCCFWIILFDHSERPLAWNAFQSHYACNPVGHMTGLFPLLVCRLPLQIKRKV